MILTETKRIEFTKGELMVLLHYARMGKTIMNDYKQVNPEEFRMNIDSALETNEADIAWLTVAIQTLENAR